MTGSTCDRAALVEALFDGRLGPSERTSTERHLKTCSECAELLRDLTSLQEMLRSSTSTISPLDHQRARLALLRETARPSAAKRRPVALLIAGLVTLPLAVWASASMFSPLRVREMKPVPPAATVASSTALPVASSPAPPAPSSFIMRRHPTSRAHNAPVQKAAPSASAQELSQASVDFAEAMKALSRGDFSASAIKLDRFVRTHPGDPRVEEAIYLSAIALERDGRSTEAKEAARRYLIAYPDGAHRAQASRVAGD